MKLAKIFILWFCICLISISGLGAVLIFISENYNFHIALSIVLAISSFAIALMATSAAYDNYKSNIKTGFYLSKDVICDNCGTNVAVYIEKGINMNDGLKNKTCPHCGCNLVHKFV